MSPWETMLLVLHVLVAVAVCGFVLLQHGKGADMGAAFGSGASGSLFGAVGSANFLSRTTAVLATVFFVTSLGLTYLGATRTAVQPNAPQGGIMERLPAGKDQPPTTTLPAPAPPQQGTSPATGTAGGEGSRAGDVPK